MKTPTYQKLALLVSFFLTWAVTAKAQNPAINSPYNKVSIASPTAASLGKYADIPVNNHTGIPEINIPLYTVKEGSLSLPISLSYHSGGIKVQEPASWVGTGWALNVGGVITRSVADKPDERGTTNAQYGHFSNYGYSSYWTVGGSGIYTASGDPAPYDFGFANGLYDGEPDLFFFNFNGYTGKFYFSDDRTPVVVDGQDLKIEYYYPVETQPAGTVTNLNIQGFIITVPTGDKYYFGITSSTAPVGASPFETTHSSSEDNAVVDDIISSYYLSKVVAADGVHTIRLTYQSDRYSYYSTAMVPISNHAPFPVGTLRNDYALVKNNVDGIRLAQIAFTNGTVTLSPAALARTDLGRYLYGGVRDDYVNTSAKALGAISIAALSFCKQYTMAYGYFGGDNSVLGSGFQSPTGITTDIERLKLESVLETSCDGTASTKPWVFEYNGNFLPRRLSLAQDHWGFYNGASTNNSINTLIPTYTINLLQEVTGASRDAVWPAMASGILTKITYPTGGSSSFEFEPNTIWVSYPTYTYLPVSTISVGRAIGNPSPQPPVNINFSANRYRFVLDYFPGSGNGSAAFSGPGVSLFADNLRTHEEVLWQPGSGIRSCTLSVNENSGSANYAVVHIYEGTASNVQANVLAGGLRIKTITTKANTAAVGIVTSYTYEVNSRSTGNLYNRPRYVQVIRNDNAARFGFQTFIPSSGFSVNGCLAASFSPTQPYLTSPCGILPMSTAQGNHIGYDQVTVAQVGNGRSEYYYYSSPSWRNSVDDVCYRNVNPAVCDPTTPNMPAVPLPYDFTRGQLKFERVFDEAGQLVKDAQYTYLYDSSKLTTPAYIVKYVGGALLGSDYIRRAYWKKQMQVIEAYSAAGQSIQTVKVYKYGSPYHRQLTETTEVLTVGDTLKTKNSYGFDFRIAACNAIADGNDVYTASCAACDAVLRQQLAGGNVPITLRHAYSIDNALCRANARKVYVTYRRANFLDGVNAFQSTHNAAKNNADAALKPLLQLQDDYTNSLVESSHWKNDQLLGASYTAFGPGLNQPTTMYPAKVFSLPLARPAATFAPATISGTGVSIDPRYLATPETALKFDQGNLVELLPRNGPVTAYLWGYNHTLPIAQATGVTHASLQAAYTNAGGDLTTLRAAPALAHALLITYAHRPLVGLTSQTDPTGRTTTYEYDALGRLSRARDEQNRILSQQQYHYADH